MLLKTIVHLLLFGIIGTRLLLAEDAGSNYSSLSSLNDGIIDDQGKEMKRVSCEKKASLPNGFEHLTKQEKKEAKHIALKSWIQHPGLLAEEQLIPDFKVTLDEEVEGLGKNGSIVWQVRVEHINGTISALIWINSESKKVHLWEVERSIKQTVELIDRSNG